MVRNTETVQELGTRNCYTNQGEKRELGKENARTRTDTEKGIGFRNRNRNCKKGPGKKSGIV